MEYIIREYDGNKNFKLELVSTYGELVSGWHEKYIQELKLNLKEQIE